MTDEPGNNPSLGSSEAASSSESRERGLGLASSLAAETYAVLEYIKDLGFEALIPPPTKGPSSPISSGQARSSGALDSKSGSPYGGPAYGAKSEAPGPGAKAGARAPSSFTPFPPSSSSGGRASGSFSPARPLDPQAPKEGPLWHQEARTLDELYQGLLGCRLCPLSAHRKKPFPGRGPQKGAKAMFLVEPPDLANAEAPKLPTGAYGALLN
ncbi:MAG: hypothetical protein LBE49_00475, partial [Deltaproteobacteria bacterium]|nr:hypothetical protein [Deltaproteobacteria bacterium]